VSGAGIEIRRTDDVEVALKLGSQAGLAEMGDDLEGMEALWGAFEDDVLIGVVDLRSRRGLGVVGWLAVSEDHRGCGLGGCLLAELESEAVRRGVTDLWATARAPGFFLVRGYAAKDEGREPRDLQADRTACSQCGITCTRRAVRKALRVAD
jgi:N-acetylglutamate synthase-like GNAT family acetyltransferase